MHDKFGPINLVPGEGQKWVEVKREKPARAKPVQFTRQQRVAHFVAAVFLAGGGVAWAWLGDWRYGVTGAAAWLVAAMGGAAMARTPKA